MNDRIHMKTKGLPAGQGAMRRIGIVAILAVLFVLNIGSAQAVGARNSTPGLNAICDESKCAVAAVPYPLTCPITTVLALIGGYFAMMPS